MGDLHQRRRELIKEIAGIERLRRGQLSEQYIEKPAADGKMKRYGPYYVWQASLKGRKRSVRVSRQNAEEVREDLGAYQQYRELCEELADVTEQITCLGPAAAEGKKKPRRPAMHSRKS